MRRALAAVMLLLAFATRAAAWDSRCYLAGGLECLSGPATARSRWIGPSDEHRALLEFGRIFGGLPSSTKNDFTLPVFTSDTEIDVTFSGGIPPPPFQSAPPPSPIPVTSLQPVNFIDTKRTQQRTMSFPEFAQLPDHAFSLWDWALGNEACPLGGGTPAVACHEFKSHMGSVNSNHFVPQSAFFYGYYHQLALTRAADCKKMITKLGDARARFAEFPIACEQEALVIEAIGQHFLQDEWASGHMWERWGSPDLADFPSPTRALLVAMTSGLIHGARAVLEDLPPEATALLGTTEYHFDDPLNAPAPVVGFRGPGDLAPQAGVGDLYLNNLVAQDGASFPAAYNRLFSCEAAGLRTVYQAAGEPEGPLGQLRAGLIAVDPVSDASCFGQRDTNAAMQKGIGLDFSTPGGTPVRIELDSFAATHLVPILSTQAGGTPTPADTAQYQVDMAHIVSIARLTAGLDPNGVTLASGGLPPLLGIESNGFYVKTPLAPYVDPPLPWPGGTGVAGDRAAALARTFHRAHAVDWCNAFHAGSSLDVDALRARAETLHDTPAAAADERTAACTVCKEFAARHLRVGTDAANYDHMREPLCNFVADNPAGAQFVYTQGGPSDTIDALAERYCDCGTKFVLIAGPPLVQPDSSAAPSINEAGTVAFVRRNDTIYTGHGGETALADYVQITGLSGQPTISNPDLGSFIGSNVAFSAFQGNAKGVFSGSGGALETKVLGLFKPRSPAVNGAGVLTFFGADDGGFPAIVTVQGGVQTFVARERVHFSDDTFLDNIALGDPDINDSGQVAFLGSFPLTSGCDDFVLRTTGDIPDRIAAGGVLDGCTGADGLDGPLAINASGQVAWLARLDTGARAVFLGASQVVSGDPDILDDFTDVALNDAGTLVYLRRTFDTSIVEGIYKGSGEKVIAAGDALFGSTVTDLEFDRDGLNNAGQIAFTASLTDGREVVVRADP